MAIQVDGRIAGARIASGMGSVTPIASNRLAPLAGGAIAAPALPAVGGGVARVSPLKPSARLAPASLMPAPTSTTARAITGKPALVTTNAGLSAALIKDGLGQYQLEPNSPAAREARTNPVIMALVANNPGLAAEYARGRYGDVATGGFVGGTKIVQPAPAPKKIAPVIRATPKAVVPKPVAAKPLKPLPKPPVFKTKPIPAVPGSAIHASPRGVVHATAPHPAKPVAHPVTVPKHSAPAKKAAAAAVAATGVPEPAVASGGLGAAINGLLGGGAGGFNYDGSSTTGTGDVNANTNPNAGAFQAITPAAAAVSSGGTFPFQAAAIMLVVGGLGIAGYEVYSRSKHGGGAAASPFKLHLPGESK